MSLLRRAGNAIGTAIGLVGAINDAQRSSRGLFQETINTAEQSTQDWRVRLSLAPGADYLYNDNNNFILSPLRFTNGVIFPYTPQINVTYAANYDYTEPVHSNYKIYQYKNSSVDQITITCDFTAQDTLEANYLLATIHFFKSVTKMFYGQDDNPRPGTPPPLCYLHGLGEFQFDKHPLVISNFTYNLPNNVDYIRAGEPSLLQATQGVELPPDGIDTSSGNTLTNIGSTIRNVSNTLSRLGGGILPGGAAQPPIFTPLNPSNTEATYVPTKIQIQLTAYPIVSRNDISNNFSLRRYANGSLLRGSQNSSGGGMW